METKKITDKMNYIEVEEEELYVNNNYAEISNPFDPKEVDIDSQPMVLSNIVERLKYSEIELDPDFQRNPNLWDKVTQSRLIESLLIRIPLPIFYFEMSDDEKLIIVDGLQRLCTIRNFMAVEKNDPNYLVLEGLEYLKEFEGCGFDMLPPSLQRRLREQVIQTYIIKAGTPEKVKNSIFERLNTRGLVLTSAEIKNSVFRGKAADLLKELAQTSEFVTATRGKIKSERMLDREFANRFLAFFILDINDYKGNLDDFLNDSLITVKYDKDIDSAYICEKFKQSMELSVNLFGDYAFRKKNRDGKFGKINKPLYEVVSVGFAKLSNEEANLLKEKKDVFLSQYNKLLNDDLFISSITNGTAGIKTVEYRHKAFNTILIDIINGTS